MTTFEMYSIVLEGGEESVLWGVMNFELERENLLSDFLLEVDC